MTPAFQTAHSFWITSHLKICFRREPTLVNGSERVAAHDAGDLVEHRRKRERPKSPAELENFDLGEVDVTTC